MPPWDRVVATPDLWPDELIDDITGWFDDLRGRWPDEEWWVRRIHEASTSSRMPILQQVNYVLITRRDFQAFARNPHGLMELGFRDPQLHTTVLPHLINMPIIRTFLAPLWAGIQTSLTLRASLNGIALDHQLVAAESGIYLRVNWEGSPYLVSQIEHMAISHTQQLHRHPTIITGGYIHNRGTTVHIPGGNRLIFSRKINLIGPNLERDIAPWINRLCGPALGSAQSSAQPLTSGCYLPYFRKGRNCSCSRVGNSGIQPVSRALPCPNGLLESMWSMDRMGVAPLPS